MEDEPIRNERLFEKNLNRVKGFECMNKVEGLDSKGIIFIIEHCLLVMAPIHESDDNNQKLFIYKICTEIIQKEKNKQKKEVEIKRGSLNSYENRHQFKNNTSLVALEQTQIKQNQKEKNLNLSLQKNNTISENSILGSKELAKSK